MTIEKDGYILETSEYYNSVRLVISEDDRLAVSYMSYMEIEELIRDLTYIKSHIGKDD